MELYGGCIVDPLVSMGETYLAFKITVVANQMPNVGLTTDQGGLP